MPVTIEQIAQKLGVSRSTVSRALNNHPRISAETKRKVHDMARELGYVPNYLAQSLSGNRTRSLGMVITHMSDPFIWQIVDGVEHTAYEHGYSIFVGMAHGNRDKEIAIIEEFQRRRVDGIIVTSSHLVQLYSEQLRHIQIPVVLINNHIESEHLRRVTIDSRSAAKRAVGHLIELGHRHIGFINVPNRPKSSEMRYHGYHDAMREAGYSPHHIRTDDRDFPPFTYVDFELGKTVAADFTKANLTAAFCYNDMVAIGLIAGLREQGFVVPDDISVVGFDDIELAQMVTPALTTVRQPRFELGEASTLMLFGALNEEPAENLVFPCELVIRGSTQQR